MAAFAKTLVFKMESALDRLLLAGKRRMGRLKDPAIVPYLSYGRENKFIVSGRVLEGGETIHSQLQDTRWNNFKNSFRRFTTVEMADQNVQMEFNSIQMHATSNSEGYFSFEFDPGPGFNQQAQWHNVSLSLAGRQTALAPEMKSTLAEVLTPANDADFGIISDIDDTILQTNVLKKAQMVSLTLFKNDHTRLPFEGATELYQALQAGPSGNKQNPFFYLSKSMWNLYDMLTQFMALNGLPKGPLFLRDLSWDHHYDRGDGPHHYKQSRIDKILSMYPHLPFILIGDSGQGDPEIYHDAAKRYPGRILAIYIRDVSLDQRDVQVVELANHLREDHELDMVFSEDTRAAFEHAAKNGFIVPAAGETKDIGSKKPE